MRCGSSRHTEPVATGRLDAVGLIVADLKVSVPFYRALGVPFPPGAEDSEHGHAEAELGGGFRLMLDSQEEIAKFDPSWRAPQGGDPRSAIAIHAGSPPEVDELYAAALAAGARSRREPWDAFWGQRYAQLSDPDGNSIDLYADQRG